MGGTRIINVMRKPAKCPRCGSQVLDIVYGTGELTEAEQLGFMGKIRIITAVKERE